MLHKRMDVVIDGDNTENCHPYLDTYVLDNYSEIDPERVRPAVLICPGGGYKSTSTREAEAIAIQMNARGFQAFVLYYSCEPEIVFPRPQLEAARAIMMIRENAKEWNVEPNKVVIMGFSAGGHLAASVSVFYNRKFLYETLHTTPEMLRPNGQVLCYPVITSGEFAHRGSFLALLGEKEELRALVSIENQVTSETPPAFIWHTYTDSVVPVENSLYLACAMRKAKVPFELHIYPRGGHGLALANEETTAVNKNQIVEEVQNWIDMAGTWIKNL